MKQRNKSKKKKYVPGEVQKLFKMKNSVKIARKATFSLKNYKKVIVIASGYEIIWGNIKRYSSSGARRSINAPTR